MRARHPLIAPVIVLALLVGGCIPQRAAPPVPLPPPAPRPTPVAAPAPTGTDWRDWPLTPGDWHYHRTPDGSYASFGMAGIDPVLTLSCENNHRVRLARSLPGTGAMTIRTTSTTRSVAIGPRGDAAFAASDPLLDAIGFSRGRFIVEQAGKPPLVIPAWAEIERVTEDCRGA